MTLFTARRDDDASLSSETLAYALTAENGADVDSRYAREFLAVPQSKLGDDPSKAPFAILSSELHGEQYQIRTATQQAEWTEKKSICQQRLAMELFKFKSTWARLIDACNGKTEHMLGHMKPCPDGLEIHYDLKLHGQVKKLATDYLSGASKFSQEELAALIVKDYNLSYCHFIKSAASEFLYEYDQVNVARIKHAESRTISGTKQHDLFDISDEVLSFEHNEGISWDLARTTVLLCRTLTGRINQLRNMLVSTNLRGCLKHAINYFYSGGGSKQSSLDQMDLFSEGVEGLMHASDMFIHGTTAKFSTYAEYWIKLRISRYIKNNHAIKIPIHVNDQMGKILRFIREWQKANDDTQLLPDRECVAAGISEAISIATWSMAMHKQSNTPFSISCVNSEGSEGNLSFDMFSEVASEGTETVRSAEAEQILNVARRLIKGEPRIIEGKEHNPSQKVEKMTQQQFDIFCLKHIQEKSHAEIAEILGNNITSKMIRRESEKAMKMIRSAMNITVENGDEDE